MQVFGLLESTQKSSTISKNAIRNYGLPNKTKAKALSEPSTDILRTICLSLAQGQCGGKAIVATRGRSAS